MSGERTIRLDLWRLVEIVVPTASALVAIGVAWGVLSTRAESAQSQINSHGKKLEQHDHHLSEHDVMMAKIVQALNDAHIARRNTERLIEIQEQP